MKQVHEGTTQKKGSRVRIAQNVLVQERGTKQKEKKAQKTKEIIHHSQDIDAPCLYGLFFWGGFCVFSSSPDPFCGQMLAQKPLLSACIVSPCDETLRMGTKVCRTPMPMPRCNMPGRQNQIKTKGVELPVERLRLRNVCILYAGGSLLVS